MLQDVADFLHLSRRVFQRNILFTRVQEIIISHVERLAIGKKCPQLSFDLEVQFLYPATSPTFLTRSWNYKKVPNKMQAFQLSHFPGL